MGGRSDTSTEKWTFGTDSWGFGANLPEPVINSAAVKSNSEENIGYLVGGELSEVGATSKVWSLSRRDMRWIEEGSKRLKTPRSEHTVVNIPGYQILRC